MTYFAPKRRNHFLTCLLAGMASSCFLLSLPALGSDDKPPPSGRSSGSRGCGLMTAPPSSDAPALILLSPNQQRGTTTSTRPTLAWFVRDADARPLEFRLYEVEKNQFKLVKEIKGNTFKTSPGIMMLSLSEADPPLTVGKRYRWQVELVCNPNRPSSNLFASAELDVVPLPTGLKQKLEQTRDRLTQATLLAEANLWYDAVSAAFGSPNSSLLKDVQRSLLNQIAITEIEHQLLSNSATVSVQP